MLKDNLMMLRTVRGYSQEEIAEKISISRQAYAKWESGESIPDLELAGKLAGIKAEMTEEEKRASGLFLRLLLEKVSGELSQ